MAVISTLPSFEFEISFKTPQENFDINNPSDYVYFFVNNTPDEHLKQNVYDVKTAKWEIINLEFQTDWNNEPTQMLVSALNKTLPYTSAQSLQSIIRLIDEQRRNINPENTLCIRLKFRVDGCNQISRSDSALTHKALLIVTIDNFHLNSTNSIQPSFPINLHNPGYVPPFIDQNLSSYFSHFTGTDYSEYSMNTKDHENNKDSIINNKKTKSKGRPAVAVSQVKQILDYISKPLHNQQTIGYEYQQPLPVQLIISEIGTRYAIYKGEFIFFESDKFKEMMYAFAYKYLSMELTDSAFKKIMTILKGSEEFWTGYDANQGHLNVRIVKQAYPNTWYYHDKGPPLNLSYTSNLNLSPCVFYPKQFKTFNIQPFVLNPIERGNIKIDARTACGNIISLLDKSCFSEEQIPLVLAWMIQTLISPDSTLLEIIGNTKQGVSSTQIIMKEIIDPSYDKFTAMPTRASDIVKIGLEEFLFSFNSVNNLTDAHQIKFRQLLSKEGLKTEGNSSKTLKQQCFISRPIILNSLSPVIDNFELQQSTLTLFIDKNSKDIDLSRFEEKINLARIELLRLSSIVNDSINDMNTEIEFTLEGYPKLYNLLIIGNFIDQLLFKGEKVFIKSFENSIKDRSFFEIENHDISYLIYLWSLENPGQDIEDSISGWINILSPIADNEKITEFSSLSPRKVGAEFLVASDILSTFNIKCFRTGKYQKSMWKITTPDTD